MTLCGLWPVATITDDIVSIITMLQFDGLQAFAVHIDHPAAHAFRMTLVRQWKSNEQ